MRQRIREQACVLLLSGCCALACASLAGAQEAAAPAAADAASGAKLYVEGGCFNCHGEQGQGGVSVDFPQGPSLRQSALERDAMIEIVSCGIPGTRMPGWLAGAYTEVACYGRPLGPAPEGMVVPGAFTKEQIESLVDYVRAEFMKK